MKVLKRQVAMAVLCMLCVAAFVLAVVFTLPARPVNAEEAFTPDIVVGTQADLKAAIQDSEWAGKPHKIQLNNDIVMDPQVGRFVVPYGYDVQLDVNGFTVNKDNKYTSQDIFTNNGKLAIIDTSSQKTGLISAKEEVFWNSGDLTLDVNIKLDSRSTITSGMVYTRAYYTSEKPSSIVQLASITINGGEYSWNSSIMFSLTDCPLTINDGKFSIKSGNLFTVMTASATASYYKDYLQGTNYDLLRGGKVTINNGDFTGVKDLAKYQLSSGLKPDSVKFEDFAVVIRDGKFGGEVSLFLPSGKWAPKSAEGNYYEIKDAPTQPEGAKAVVEVEAGGGFEANTIYFDSFERAFNAAKILLNPNARTVKLLDDYSSSDTLDLAARTPTGQSLTTSDLSWGNNFDFTLDLNGHDLKVSNINNHLANIGVSYTGHILRAFVKNSADLGELILDYPEADTEKDFSDSALPGILLRKGTTQPTLTFENVTIRRTGYLPENYYNMEEDNAKLKNTALLQFDQYAEAGHMMKFINCDIVSSLEYNRLPNEDGEVPPAYPSTPGLLAAFKTSNSYDYDITAEGSYQWNKQETLVFEFNDEKEHAYSWDISYFLPDGYVCISDGTGSYKVVPAGESPYVSNGQQWSTLQNAVNSAAPNGTIYIVTDANETEKVTIEKPLNIVFNERSPLTLTLNSGMEISADVKFYGGSISGAVTVLDGNVEFATMNLNADAALTVSGGNVLISSGEYSGAFTVDGGELEIAGGSFRGDRIESIDQYIRLGFGAYRDKEATEYQNSEFYEITIAPSLAARDWYDSADKTEYTIGSVAEWMYFSSYVNSGYDSFETKTVKLTADIEFNPNAASGISLASEPTAPNFIPAGNAAHNFNGAFDGQGYTMSGIYAREYSVGLFGRTGSSVSFKNIKVTNSKFVIGSGYLDSLNEKLDIYAAGGIVGAGFLGKSGSISVTGTTFSVEVSGTPYIGGVLGHTYGTLDLTKVIINEVTFTGGFKVGGVVGLVESGITIHDAEVTNTTVPKGPFLFGGAGALIGHANSTNTVLTNIHVEEPDESLIGLAQGSGGADGGNLTITGKYTDIDVYSIYGSGRPDNCTIEITGEATEDGVARSSVKTHWTEDYLTFTDGEGNPITPEMNAGGGYDVQATVHVEVVVCDIVVADVTYGDNTVTATSFKLKDTFGHDVDFTGEDLTLTLTLKESNYNVGTNVALIVGLSLSGDAAGNYTLALAGQQAFVEVEVIPARLVVRAVGNGAVEYEGFVNGEDESVLTGELVFERKGNVITPSELESANYDIVFESVTVPADLTALWVGLAIAGMSAILAAGLYIGYRRKRQ